MTTVTGSAMHIAGSAEYFFFFFSKRDQSKNRSPAPPPVPLMVLIHCTILKALWEAVREMSEMMRGPVSPLARRA
jgi:hypothetical protein